MLFNSLEFFIFFPIVVALYFICPARYRWVLLLAASYYFYAAWKAEYVVLIAASTLVGYLTALAIARQTGQTARKALLLLSLSVNLGILFAFKYANFFNDSLRTVLNQANIFYEVPFFQFLLPVGISFYTFQVVGYTIDVYRGQLEPERHLGIFALFVAFFPQLVAGPIERAGQMLPQFYRRFTFDPIRITGGLRLILWGLFQKVVIADRLGLYVDAVYNNPTDYRGWPVLLATFFFAFQIYCDFAGYTDIAIGLAKVLGFELMTNFQQPYFATSPADFWRRWHISLSTWFRDYLYIPLGGNRVPVARHYFNLFVVFLLSGLWHGASWTFVIWGGLHGLYIILEQAGRGLWPKLTAHLRPTTFPALPTILGSLLTFLLICLTWLFFRANTVADAFLLLSRLFPLTHFDAVNTPWEAVAANPAVQMPLALGLILLLLAVQALQRWEGPYPLLRVQPTWLRWGAYIVLALAVLNLGVTEAAPFIYFQF